MEFEVGEQVVVVVAHPDDETFGCGSLIAAAVAAGAHVTVICATLGEAGERRPDGATDHLPLAEVRERELRSAGTILGVHEIEILGLGDSGFDGLLPHGALCTVPVAQLAADLQPRLLGRRASTVIILDAGDGHRDHRHIRDAVELLAAATDRPLRVARSCLPNSLMRRWVAEMIEQAPDSPYVHIDLEAIGTPDDQLTAVDASHVLDARVRAMECHRSQGSPFDAISPELRRAFLSTDHVLVTVHPE